MGYSHHVRGKKAVSPVVATLILILIAVAAAAALYLWLVAWQGGVTKGIGSPSAQYTISIGGSTSAYPFAEEAATQFEANNSDVVISVNQGGSGAGAAAVCSGQVDIGQASSFAYPVSTLISADGCPSTTVEQVIAYDGVDLITPSANSHGLESMSWDTAQAIWTTASNEPVGYGGTTGAGSVPGTPVANLYANGGVFMNGFEAPVQVAQGTNYAWDQIPACAPAQASCAATGFPDVLNPVEPATALATTVTSSGYTISAAGTYTETATVETSAAVPAAFAQVYEDSLNLVVADLHSAGGDTLSALTGPTITSQSLSGGIATVTFSFGFTEAGATFPDTVTIGTAPAITAYVPDAAQSGSAVAATGTACDTNDICATAGAQYVSPCGFTVCAGGTLGNAATKSIDLYYRSDVSGTTTGLLARLLAVSATGDSAAGLSFSGCGGDNEFDGCGLAFSGTDDHGEQGNPAVISAVAGDPNGLGYASDGLAQATGSGVVPVDFQGYGQTVVVDIVGESTALKAISKGISDYFTTASTINSDQAYVGWRPFVNIETAPPTGEVLRYLEFVMDPANNQNIADETAEISIYASGLAGVVPITPVSGSTDLP